MKRALLLSFLLLSCRRDDAGFRVRELPAVPRGLPATVDPPDNPTTPAKVTLGRALFYDKRLSATDFMACNDCHRDDHGWAGNEPKSVNAMGKRTRRKAPTVVNAAYFPAYGWDGRAATMEEVIAIGWSQLGVTDQEVIAQKLERIPAYRALFQEAFGAAPSGLAIRRALGAYIRVLRAGDAPYDRGTMSDAQKRGLSHFERLGCGNCHAPPLFSDGRFHHVGTADASDRGRIEHTKMAADDGAFRTPSLRDVTLTGPWLHDGSATTLEQAITRMALAEGAKDPAMKPHALSPEELAELRAFLEALTGSPTLLAPKVLPDGTKPN